MAANQSETIIPFWVKAITVVAVIVGWSYYSDAQDKMKQQQSAIEQKTRHQQRVSELAAAPTLPPAYRFMLSASSGDEDGPSDIEISLHTFILHPDGELQYSPSYRGKVNNTLIVEEDRFWSWNTYFHGTSEPLMVKSLVHQSFAVNQTILIAKKEVARLKSKTYLSKKDSLYVTAVEEALANEFTAEVKLPGDKKYSLVKLTIPLSNPIPVQ